MCEDAGESVERVGEEGDVGTTGGGQPSFGLLPFDPVRTPPAHAHITVELRYMFTRMRSHTRMM